LKKNWIIVRNFSKNKYTKNCLRISIWNERENNKVLEILKKY
jgi:histidinol-phosphate/aromatic aminotransferase/cobyric acid decarboxylase-like protein